jgi:hypothetical protein
MPTLISFSILLIFCMQTGFQPNFPEGLFTAKEQKKLDRNPDDLEDRIEVYKDACDRIYKNFSKDASKGNYETALDQLKTWTLLLSESVKDIEANINPQKRKLKDLTQYEIQIRKAISDLHDYWLQAPYEQQNTFEKYIESADKTRNRIVDILFK